MSDIFKGFNIKTGPTLFVGHFSQEAASHVVANLTTGEQISRTSILAVNKLVDIGYLVAVSYEAQFSKKVFVCANINFANYRNNDGYSSYGIGAGFRL
ncbi:MAG TPA: hypothetical protein VF610_07330 [Segetibacter sp.]